MGLTTIKWIENRSGSTVKVFDKEFPNGLGHTVELAPGQEDMADMSVPWVFQEGDFDEHRLLVQIDGVVRCSIWQSNQSDGDFVRCSTDETWSDPGAHVEGVAKVDGNRTMVVFDDRVELFAQPDGFGVTTIVRLDNAASEPVALIDVEDPNAEGSGAQIQPGQAQRTYIPVPWADTSAKFASGNYLVVAIGGVERFWIWQANLPDGDFVRYSTNGAHHKPGAHVPGAVGVGFSGALVVTDGTIELQRIVGRPPRPPESGVDRVQLMRPDDSTFIYTGRSHHPDRPARIKTVKNVAEDVNGNETIPLEVSHEDSTGASFGPIKLDPGEGVAFDDLTVDGTWIARASGSNVFLTNSVVLEVAWEFDHEAGTASRVRCVVQDSGADPDKRIQALGGTLPDGSRWQIDIDTAIARVGEGASLYVEEGGARSYLVVATSAAGVKYLKTEADGVDPDNLSALPSCP